MRRKLVAAIFKDKLNVRVQSRLRKQSLHSEYQGFDGHLSEGSA